MAKTSTFQWTITINDDGDITRHHNPKETYSPSPGVQYPQTLKRSGEDDEHNVISVPDNPAASRVSVTPPSGSAVTKFLNWSSDDEDEDDSDATFEVAPDQFFSFGVPTGMSRLHIHASARETVLVEYD